MLYFHLLLSRKSNLLVGFNVCAYHLKDLQNKFYAVFFFIMFIKKKLSLLSVRFLANIYINIYIYKYWYRSPIPLFLVFGKILTHFIF